MTVHYARHRFSVDEYHRMAQGGVVVATAGDAIHLSAFPDVVLRHEDVFQ